ncbi:MAG: hypothetical protein DRI90_26575 [Deltaproteobacteria bacterium]|nr:MAG: hypothetical protein DRI90_26575 [Deltaproteobacteria bacterium]
MSSPPARIDHIRNLLQPYEPQVAIDPIPCGIPCAVPCQRFAPNFIPIPEPRLIQPAPRIHALELH